MNRIIFLAFVASIEFVHETDSEYEFIDEHNASFLSWEYCCWTSMLDWEIFGS